MYSVNNVALDNATFGWRLMRPTRPLINLVLERGTVSAPGGHGTVPGMPASLAPPVLTFVVLTPFAEFESLQALWLHGSTLSYTGDPSKVVEYELLSTSHTPYGPAMETVRLDVTVRLAEVFWRDAAETTSAFKSLTAASVNVDAWAGTSGIITDALVRVRGPFSGLQVRSGGSWFSVPGSIGSGEYVRFRSNTGVAYLTTSDTWTGGTDISGDVDFDGPDGYFRIVPTITNPANRVARVEVTTTSRSTGAAAQLRGRGSYLA